MFPEIRSGLSQTQKAQEHKSRADKCVVVFLHVFLKAPCVSFPPIVITYSFVC